MGLVWLLIPATKVLHGRGETSPLRLTKYFDNVVLEKRKQSCNNELFFKKWVTPCLFLIFFVFSDKHYNFYNK